MPGEGIEEFPNLEDSALHSELAAHEGEVANPVVGGEVNWDGDPPSAQSGLRHGAGAEEVVLDLVEAVGVGDSDDFSFFRKGEEAPKSPGSEVDGGGLHEIDLVSGFDEFIDQEFEILGEIHPDGGVRVVLENVRRQRQEREDVVVPGVEALGESQLDGILEKLLGGRGKLRVACAYVLPKEGDADDFTFVGLGIDMRSMPYHSSSWAFSGKVASALNSSTCSSVKTGKISVQDIVFSIFDVGN